MKIIPCDQLTPEWWSAKRGMPTASNFDRILTAEGASPAWTCVVQVVGTSDVSTCGTRHRTFEAAEECCRKAAKKNPGRHCEPIECKPLLSSQHTDLICDLIGDTFRLTPRSEGGEGYVSKAMQEGIDTEPRARAWYELETGQDVERVGLCTTDDDRFGCSPDGLIKGDGGHVGALELKCPTMKTQVRYLLDNKLPAEYTAQVHGTLIVTGLPWIDFLSYAPGLPAFLVRVTPDDYTQKLREALDVFWANYQRDLDKIRSM